MYEIHIQSNGCTFKVCEERSFSKANTKAVQITKEGPLDCSAALIKDNQFIKCYVRQETTTGHTYVKHVLP